MISDQKKTSDYRSLRPFTLGRLLTMKPFHGIILPRDHLSELAKFRMSATSRLHQAETHQARLRADDVF